MRQGGGIRVTGGELRGRVIKVPVGPVRPTQDKVRLAQFSMLANVLPDARVLDLFAGSGSLGIEAWSRGASEVWWVENHPKVFSMLQENVATLCGGGQKTRCVCSDVFKFLRQPPVGLQADIILADPPYIPEERPVFNASGLSLLSELMQACEQGGVLVPQGLLVFEQSTERTTIQREGWELLRERDYGKTTLLLYRYGPEPVPVPGA